MHNEEVDCGLPHGGRDKVEKNAQGVDVRKISLI
jgi:hypothetical protein